MTGEEESFMWLSSLKAQLLGYPQEILTNTHRSDGNFPRREGNNFTGALQTPRADVTAPAQPLPESLQPHCGPLPRHNG